MTTLYKKNKDGSIQQWTVLKSGEDIVTRYGKLNGAVQEARKTCTVKNPGRSNETSASEQALVEIESLIKKQKRKGYFETVVEAEQETVLRPMLASSFEDKKSKVTYPLYIQPKLDGVRCLAFWEKGRVKLLSRGAKEYNLPHIAEELESLIPINGTIFDGEIYLHGIPLQEINSRVQKDHKELTEELEYHVYDIFNPLYDESWSERHQTLQTFTDYFKAHQKIKVVQTQIASTEEEVYKMQKTFVEQGYEGAIVRCPDLKYEVGHRSNKLLKVKSFKDDEFRIVDYTEGEGKFKGCVIWICETKDGHRFNVVPKGTLDQKKQFFIFASDYIGSLLKVKYFQLTNDGIPQFPVGLAIRLTEDL